MISRFDLTGSERAAALLVALGPDIASDILKNLDEEQIEQITIEIARIGNLSLEDRENLLGEFLIDLQKQDRTHTLQGKSVAKDFLQKAFGAEKSDELIDKFESQDVDLNKEFAFIQEIDAETISILLENEHVQTISLILNYVPARTSADVLKLFGRDKAAAIAVRMAKMSQIVPDAAVSVARSLKERYKQFLEQGAGGRTEEGLSSLLNIFSHLPGDDEKRIMGHFDNVAPGISQQIRERVFTFENLMSLNNAEMRILIDEINDDRLIALALKGAEDDVRVKFLRNMSQNRATDIIQDMDIMGPVRLSEIEDGRHSIVQIMRELNENGVISLRKGSDIYVE